MSHAAEDGDGESFKLVHIWPDFLAGLIAGSSGVVIGHPLDTIKVRKQSSYLFPRQTVLFTKSETLSSVTQIRVLYRGMLFPFLSEGARQSLFFGVYGLCLKQLQALRAAGGWYGTLEQHLSKQQLEYVDVSIAAAVGGVAQSIIATPVEQIKVIKQAQRSREVVSSRVFARDAIRSRYFLRHTTQTFLITALRESYSYSVYMLVYVWAMRQVDEKMTAYKNEETGRFSNSAINNFCNSMFSGGIAGMASWGVSMPFDNVKTRLQVEFCKPSPRYAGISDCFIKIWRQEGLRSLWSGMGVVCLRAFPVNAVTLTAYTYFLDWFNQYYGV